MQTPHRLMSLLIGTSLLVAGGCGQLAYKTGAGADALRADEQACRQAGGDPAGYDRCMHDKGWTTADLSSGNEAPLAMAPASAAAAPAIPGPNSSSDTDAEAPASAAAPAQDPTAKVKVTSWVHFGGGGPDDDIAACVAALGAAHQPDKANHIVTRALLACMRGKGWRGM